jgi:hypothetical protein
MASLRGSLSIGAVEVTLDWYGAAAPAKRAAYASFKVLAECRRLGTPLARPNLQAKIMAKLFQLWLSFRW